jgi:hypothetical protein
MLQKGRSSDSALSWPRRAPPAEVPPLDRGRIVGKPYLRITSHLPVIRPQLNGRSYESSICRDQVLLLWASNTRDISSRHAAFSRSFSHLSFLLSFDCSVCRRGQAIRVSANQIGRDLPWEVLAAPLFIRKAQMVRRETCRGASLCQCGLDSHFRGDGRPGR